MMEAEIFSRSARLGALISGKPEEAIAHLFTKERILIRLQAEFGEVADARETFLFVVNQVLRFCSNVSVSVPGGRRDLIRACDELATQVHGPGAGVEVVKSPTARSFDAIVNIGTQVLAGLPSSTVNSSGWVARWATAESGTSRLHWSPKGCNPLGALAAACLGAGAAFLTILGEPVMSLLETSLFSHEVGPPGTLSPGPALPRFPLYLDAFLVGCGAVSSGWAYAVRRLPIVGRLQAIDRESLRLENLGPYVAAGRRWIGKTKTSLIRGLLWPAIDVTERADQWDFFRIRLRGELETPPVIICGLDNVRTRHSVQRLWPEVLIDMGARGLESRVLVKSKRNPGLCLLGGLAVPPDEPDWAESASRASGLSVEVILNDPTGEITQAEVDGASADKQVELRRDLGKARCGHINRQTLEMEGHDPDFAPAVPFVTAFSGLVGAAETVKLLLGDRYSHSLHFQKSFQSGRSMPLEMVCDPGCECQVSQG